MHHGSRHRKTNKLDQNGERVWTLPHLVYTGKLLNFTSKITNIGFDLISSLENAFVLQKSMHFEAIASRMDAEACFFVIYP